MTNQQRKALHLFFRLISDEFNEIGFTNSVELMNFVFDLRFTDRIVKEQIIKPLIKQIWDYDSTNELHTKDINEIIDIFNIQLGKMGRDVQFPSIESLMFKLDKANLKERVLINGEIIEDDEIKQIVLDKYRDRNSECP